MRELELTRDGLKGQEEKRKAAIAQLALELQRTNRDVVNWKREKLENLKADHEQETEKARQRLKRKETQLKEKDHALQSSEKQLQAAEKEKAQLQDTMEDLEDQEKYLTLGSDRLQTKVDAMFLVGACVAGGTDDRLTSLAATEAAARSPARAELTKAAHDRELARLGTTTLSKLRLLPAATTNLEVGEMVRDFLERTQLDAVKAGALSFAVRFDGGNTKKQLIQQIMKQKFSA